jgi:hypothetical protein
MSSKKKSNTKYKQKSSKIESKTINETPITPSRFKTPPVESSSEDFVNDIECDTDEMIEKVNILYNDLHNTCINKRGRVWAFTIVARDPLIINHANDVSVVYQHEVDAYGIDIIKGVVRVRNAIFHTGLSKIFGCKILTCKCITNWYVGLNNCTNYFKRTAGLFFIGKVPRCKWVPLHNVIKRIRKGEITKKKVYTNFPDLYKLHTYTFENHFHVFKTPFDQLNKQKTIKWFIISGSPGMGKTSFIKTICLQPIGE